MTLDAAVKISVTNCLVRMIENYYSDRVLEYQCMCEFSQRSITAGILQGAVLVPALWNIMYNKLLRTHMLKKANLVVCRHNRDAKVQPALSPSRRRGRTKCQEMNDKLRITAHVDKAGKQHKLPNNSPDWSQTSVNPSRREDDYITKWSTPSSYKDLQNELTPRGCKELRSCW